MEDKKALYIGRFQPFHKGHLKIIEEISKKYKTIIIGIGSSQYSHTKKNPFSKEERKRMINGSLKENNIKNFDIIEIPDIHNPQKWVNHVESIFSDIDVVITNNRLNQTLFKQKGYNVKTTKSYKRSKFSGKEIRRRIRNHEKWEHLVPKSAKNIINEIDGEKRLINSINDEI